LQGTERHAKSTAGTADAEYRDCSCCSAEREAQSQACKLTLLASTACGCLTPRSSGAPTAGHQSRAGGTLYIFTGPGLASCRRRPLSSNVMPRSNTALPHCLCIQGQQAQRRARKLPHDSAPARTAKDRPSLNAWPRGSKTFASPLPVQVTVFTANETRRGARKMMEAPCTASDVATFKRHQDEPAVASGRTDQLRTPRRHTYAPSDPPPSAYAVLARTQRLAFQQARHNPSVNRSANGRPPAPGRWYAVHFHRPGAGVLPSSPGYLER
jgi:hypothetical protein